MRTTQSAKPVFPVGLLLEGRRCLVVGGGRTALHKTRLLMQARSQVRVVSPHIVPELAALAGEQQIEWIERPFQDEDVHDVGLVYAATNDRTANRHVLQCCRARSVLCCCVDRNWPASDFITPATFRHGGLVVTVSTGGRSCRHSRLVKDTLQRHIQLVENTDLLVMGTSHDMLPIERRERFHLAGDALHDSGRLLSQIWGVHEFAVLNTCNRIEILAAVADESPVESLIAMILGFHDLADEEFYIKRGENAFEHTALLCAGLLSQTPGENNIVAQVKAAVDHAVTKEWAGGILTEWLDSSLHISKHIRQSAGNHLQAAEIDQLCLAYLDEARNGLADAAVLVVGTGVVGQSLIRQLVQRGAACTWCYHVRKPTIPDTWTTRVRLCQLDQLKHVIGKHSIVICAAGSDKPLITAAETAAIPADNTIMIADLAVPRNVSPDACIRRENVTCLDLDQLKQWHRKRVLNLDAVFETSHTITSDHADFYDKLIRSIQGGNPH